MLLLLNDRDCSLAVLCKRNKEARDEIRSILKKLKNTDKKVDQSIFRTLTK